MTCLSCHSFEKGWLVSGDANTGRFLLARSGNPVEWQEDKLTTYLCTGCHSASPGTGEQKGHSHPTMRADVTKLLQEIPVPLSGTPSGHMNCDSCHRPHEAMTRGGYYILEQVDGLNDDPRAVHPQIDFTSLCHLCHGEATY